MNVRAVLVESAVVQSARGAASLAVLHAAARLADAICQDVVSWHERLASWPAAGLCYCWCSFRSADVQVPWFQPSCIALQLSVVVDVIRVTMAQLN
jgi:hypothetical protein